VLSNTKLDIGSFRWLMSLIEQIRERIKERILREQQQAMHSAIVETATPESIRTNGGVELTSLNVRSTIGGGGGGSLASRLCGGAIRPNRLGKHTTSTRNGQLCARMLERCG
jgi:hypothetical protein